MAKITRPVSLSGSNIELATYYTANHNMYRRGPVSQHIVHLGRFNGTMDNAVEALGEVFDTDDSDLAETISLSGLADFTRSLRPRIGGSMYDQDNGISYLDSGSGVGLQEMPGPYHWQCIQGSFGPYHELLGQRISRYDFGKMAVHILTNTELQDSYSQFGIPTDPRLPLVDSLRGVTIP
jgi:hypothetical protein